MKKSNKNERSLFITITASAIGIVILGVSLLLLPINGFWEGVTFVSGLLLTFVFAVTAYEGKKGTLLDALMSFSFWR
jgi:CHASE2 domain-containing sensor protein